MIQIDRFSTRSNTIILKTDRLLFVGALSQEVNEKDLFDLFKTYGEVVDVKVIKTQTGGCKGYGFLEFKHEESAEIAKSSLQGHFLKGRAIDIKMGKNEGCLYISGLNKSWTENEVEEKLKAVFPGVSNIAYIHDTENIGFNRGYAFVFFETKIIAQNVLNSIVRGDYTVDGYKMSGNWADSQTNFSEGEGINVNQNQSP